MEKWGEGMNGLHEIFEKGGPVLYVIVACSLVAMTVAIERWLFYRHVEKEDTSLIPQLKKIRPYGAIPADMPQNGPLFRIWQAISKRDVGSMAAAEGILSTETMGLESRLYMLATIGTIAPLLGLLGTVLGMIRTFHTVSLNGVTNPSTLALGISEALYNTAGGLMVTVPCIIGYNFFHNWADQLAGVLEARFKELTAQSARGERDAG